MPSSFPAGQPPAFVRRFWPALLFLVASTLLRADPALEANAKPQVGPAPGWVQVRPWQAPLQLEPNSTGQRFLLLDQQTKVATGENYQRSVYQVVSEHGREDAAQIYFHFDPSYQTLAIHEIKLIRDGAASDRLDPDKIQLLQQERDLDRQLYNGTRSALVILDDVRVGDIIDLSYTVRGTNPVFGHRFLDTQAFGWSMPVREQHYRLLVPPGRQIAAKTVGQPGITSTVAPQDGGQDIDWSRTDIPLLESEDRIPSTEYVYPFIDLSEFRTWREVVDWAVPLYAPETTPSPLLDALVAKLRSGATSPEQQVVDALAFVQQEIRYLGIEMGASSHRPSAPEEVLRRRFGDCKDKARLLSTILQRLGLQAAPALVNSFRREAVRERLPTPFAFDHVIVALDFQGRRYLLDPTLSYQRGDGLALRHVGRYGVYLRIAPAGRDDPAETGLESAELGAGDLQRSEITQEFDCPGFDLPAALTVTTTASGRAAENLRAYFTTHTAEQISREYLDYYTRYYANISRVRLVEHADQPRTNTFKITESYKLDRLFTRDDPKADYRASFQPANIWEYVRTANLVERHGPYSISHPVSLHERIVVRLPEKWAITPGRETVEDQAFLLRYEAALPDPRRVVLDYTWESRSYAVPVQRLPQFSSHLKEARAKMGYQLSWKPEKVAAAPAAASSPASFQLNWPMAGLAGLICAAGLYAGIRLLRRTNPEPPLLASAAPATSASIANDMYSRAAKRENLEGIGGWLLLVGFGMFIRPFVWLYTLVQGRHAFFDQRVWNLLTDPASDRYREHFALIAPLEMAFEVLLMTYCLVMLPLFLRRSYLFPRTIQVYLGLAIGFTLFSLWDNYMLGQTLTMDNYGAVFQTALVAAVWIPYFQMSRRVKATFTR